MQLSPEEIHETLLMVQQQHLDIRTVTLGVSLDGCAAGDPARVALRVGDTVRRAAERLVPVAEAVAREYGVPIVNKRIAVTPIAQLATGLDPDALLAVAAEMDRAAADVGVDFIGGFSALVHKGIGEGDRRLMDAIPDALASTLRVCASVNVASTRAGINV
ncbi:MAG: DUF711 family protein, partial [Actinobacteria bacterium]